MMAQMPAKDPNASLLDDFEPAPLAIGPDGGLAITDRARAIPPPPRLCAAGPCRHYHCFVTQLNAERAIGAEVQRDGDQHGRVIGDAGPGPFYTKVHHYCYPTVGVEMDLGDVPVLECNFWDPVDEEDRARSATASVLLDEYALNLEAWQDERKAEDEAEDALYDPPVTHLVVTCNGDPREVDVTAETTLRAVRAHLLSVDDPELDPEDREAIIDLQNKHAPVDEWMFFDELGNEITNLDATLHQLGIKDGERLTLTLPVGKGA